MPTKTQPTCVLISQSGTYLGKQGLEYFNGVSTGTAGAQALCLHVVTIPPGGRAKPHLHENHESAVYVISGEAGMWYGEGLRQHMWMRAGDFAHIPANVPTYLTMPARGFRASAWSLEPTQTNRKALPC